MNADFGYQISSGGADAAFRFFRNRPCSIAKFPDTIIPSGTFFVTTAPRLTLQRSPTITLLETVALTPTQESLPIRLFPEIPDPAAINALSAI